MNEKFNLEEKIGKKAENTVNINKEFLSTIAPEGGITFKEDRYVKTGNGYEACIHVIDTPVNVGQYWLADIINRDDTVVVLDVVSENRAVTLKKLKKQCLNNNLVLLKREQFKKNIVLNMN